MPRKLMALLLTLLMACAMIPAISHAEAEAPDPWTVTVFIGDPYDQPTSTNKIYKMIEEEFGITFQFEFIAGDLLETLGVKIAGQDYSDLMSGSNYAEKLIEAGAFIDLMPYLSPEKTPNLWAHYEPYWKRIQSEKGEFFVLANYGRIYNDNIVNFCNGPAFWIQKKVLAWDNYPTIKTLDQYFDLLLRYKEAHPTTEDGLPTSGFEVLSEDWRAFCLYNAPQHLMGHPNDGDVFVHWDDDYKVDFFINKDYSKQYYAKLNEVFNKGLIEQDTFVQNYDQYMAKITSGRVLGMFDQYWDFQNATNALVDAQKDPDTYVGLPLVYDESITEHYLDRSVLNVNRGFGISVDCKDPERLVMMIERLLDDDWQTILWWGIEGEDYYVEDGRYLRTLEQKTNAEDPVWVNANKARALQEALPKKQGTMDNGNAWEPRLQPEIYFEMMRDYDKDFFTAYGMKMPADFFNPAPENEAYYPAWQIDRNPYPDIEDIFQKLTDVRRRDLPAVIMAAPEKFNEAWDKFVTTVDEAGAPEFEDWMYERIVELNEKLK